MQIKMELMILLEIQFFNSIGNNSKPKDFSIFRLGNASVSFSKQKYKKKTLLGMNT